MAKCASCNITGYLNNFTELFQNQEHTKHEPVDTVIASSPPDAVVIIGGVAAMLSVTLCATETPTLTQNTANNIKATDRVAHIMNPLLVFTVVSGDFDRILAVTVRLHLTPTNDSLSV